MARRGGKRRRNKSQQKRDNLAGCDGHGLGLSSALDKNKNNDDDDDDEGAIELKKRRLDAQDDCSNNDDVGKGTLLAESTGRIHISFVNDCDDDAKPSLEEDIDRHHNLPPPLFDAEGEPKLQQRNDADVEKKSKKKIKALFSAFQRYLDTTQKNRIDDGRNFITSWKPTLIQRQLWSILLQTPFHAIAISPTSSGKTLSYAIPSLLDCDDHCNIVVIVPTKELVHQVSLVYKRLIPILLRLRQETTNNNYVSVTTRMVIPVHGGVSREEQIQAITSARNEKRPTAVVATPGRFLDILKQLQQSSADHFRGTMLSPTVGQGWIVLDEADQLTKEGDLGPQVHEILTRVIGEKKLSTQARLVFVSATMNEKSSSTFRKWIGDRHVLIHVDKGKMPPIKTATSPGPVNNASTTTEVVDSSTKEKHSPPKTVLFSRIPSHLEQIVHVCAEHKKPRKLVHILQTIQKAKLQPREKGVKGSSDNGIGRPAHSLFVKGIVFYSKIEKLEHSYKLLRKEGLHCLPLHGQLPTSVRQKNLQCFASVGRGRGGEMGLCLLLATDVAARGIDIPGIDFVIQYDFPGNLEQYVHRCGRAGRSSFGDTSKKPNSDVSAVASNQYDQKRFQVFSFFTRNLQPMAADLVRLLELNQAWIDPNLRSLVLMGKKPTTAKANNDHTNHPSMADGEPSTGSTQSSSLSKPKSKKKPRKAPDLISNPKSVTAGESSSDYDDDFEHLSANRIVLKRASHVSDASDDDDDD